MPWVYTLSLTEFTDAAQIKSDWEDNIPGNASIVNDHGGVTVSGTRCVIVSQRNNPEFQEMENLGYVLSIAESKEIPSRGSSEFDPPVDLGHNIELVK